MVNDRSVRGSVRGGCGVKFVPTYKYVMHNLTVNSSIYGYINSSAVGDRQSNSNALVRVPVIYANRNPTWEAPSPHPTFTVSAIALGWAQHIMNIESLAICLMHIT